MLGDLRYGRTVHSLSHALAKFDNKLSFISPDSLSMPSYVTDDLSCDWSSHNSIEDVLNDLDVLYVTRIQKERFPDLEEYKKVAVLICNLLPIIKGFTNQHIRTLINCPTNHF